MLFQDPSLLRAAIKQNKFNENTSGQAPGYVQCNLVILPVQYADDFEVFCDKNSQACPLIYKASEAGEYALTALGTDVDIRTDIPKYKHFIDGQFVEELSDIRAIWQQDYVSFLLGCSFSFEEALLEEGIEIRNISENKNVPMFITNRACESVGPFSGPLVVSMRPMTLENAERAVEICKQFPRVHGEPVHIGDPKALGIAHINEPDFGDAVTIKEGEVPVFWACGVTPQMAIMAAKPSSCITHSPGYMLVTDLKNSALRVATI
ncbi:putative hydro-lyase [Thalassotalea agarivorans]|uniref:Putative hydro-lyase SAMN05660429_01375 n=1 Tax=Thalassotalea agarivorans TaxID=349064 RepID=A0A1I0CYL5_THASX|nr:putative hydro-lyase [Thalassotalea agarivorans]SET24715.1 Uncharacterized protein YcsI, UPF0317 family [Thalassotalea agarivorans]